MTLPIEVLRILSRDLRMLRWPLAAWGALVALSVLRGLGVRPDFVAVLVPVTVLVPAMAAVLVALAVAGDPAIPGPTFWGVQHQRPEAVTGAKVLFASLLMVVMAIGHAMVLVSHDLPPRAVVTLASVAARDAIAWLLFAAALGAGVRGTRAWVTQLGAIAAGSALLVVLPGALGSSGAPWPVVRGHASLLLLAASGAILAWSYHRRLVGVPTWVRTAVLAVAAAVMLVTPVESRATDARVPTLARDAALTVDTAHATARIEGRDAVVELPLTYPDSSHVVAATAAWAMHLDDGSVVHLLPGGARARRVARLHRTEDDLADWGRGPVTRTVQFRFPLDSVTRARVDGRVVRIGLALETDRLAMRPLVRFAGRTGGTAAHDGLRIRVGAAEPDGRFPASISRVWTEAADAATPRTVAYAAGPVLTHRGTGRGATVVLRADGDATADERPAGWVLPGNAMQAWATSLGADGLRVPPGDGVVTVLVGRYAGRVELGLLVPVASRASRAAR